MKINKTISVLLLFSGVAQMAQISSAVEPVDYSKLTRENLPSLRLVIKEVLAESTSGSLDMKKERRRIRLRNLLPSLIVNYGGHERSVNDYGYVTETTDVTYSRGGSPGLPGYDYVSDTTAMNGVGQHIESMPSGYVGATWYLNKLMVDPDEIYALDIRGKSMYYQQRAVDAAIQVYTELKDLMAERSAGEVDEDLELDIAGLVAELDAMTGDYLTDVILTDRISKALPESAGTVKALRLSVEARDEATNGLMSIANPANPLMEEIGSIMTELGSDE